MARKDDFEFDIPDKKEKKERPQREKKEGKSLSGNGSFLDKLPLKKSSSDDFEFSLGEGKKEKQQEKKESKPLFGEGSVLGGLFKKSSSDDSDFSLDEGNNEKSGKKSSKRLKWWHILLIVLGSIIVVVGIVAGILIGQINDIISDIGGEGDEIPEPEGTVTTIGTYLPDSAQEYTLCEYTEHFSGKTIVTLQNTNTLPYDGKSYYILIEDGRPIYDFSGEYTGEYTQEQTKDTLLSLLKRVAGYTDEQLAKCDVHIYQPVSFTRVTISELTLTETDATVKYSAGAVDGEMTEEFTLTGTYTKAENDYTFTYPTLPEDANLLRVAENLLGTASYAYYAQYGAWVNELTFGDNYKLTLVSPDGE